jgi:hypothetical protein
MTLEALTNTRKIALAADWLEIAAVMSSRSSSSSADLARSLAVIEDDEHARISIEPDSGEVLEEEILNHEGEQWISDVREEIFIRSTSLGDSYPFNLIGNGRAWRVEHVADGGRHDHLFYLCCLIITARRHRLVLVDFDEMDKVLQVVAYLVAGRLVQGEAYWFGHPRPDSTRMKEAVEVMLNRMGFDAPAVVPPIWSIGRENDDGVDLVAWRNFGDRLASRIVLYGQVASGKNWEDKPVARHVEATFHGWLRDYAQKYFVPAMFIAWPQYISVEAGGGRTFRQRVLEIAVKNERHLGLTIDRGRIAELAGPSVGEGKADEPPLFSYLTQWRDDAIQKLTA